MHDLEWVKLDENFWIENSLNWLVTGGNIELVTCKTDKKTSTHTVYHNRKGDYIKHNGKRYFFVKQYFKH
jgi:hypothetical protein